MWILLVAVLIVMAFLKIIINANKQYKCPCCGCVFKPKINNYFRLLLNFSSGGFALKCPKCQNKSIMHEYR